MKTIGLRELRRHAAEFVKEAENGEEIEITVAGRLAARLVPATPKRWQPWDTVTDLFAAPDDPDWERDRDLVDQCSSRVMDVVASGIDGARANASPLNPNGHRAEEPNVARIDSTWRFSA